MTVEEARRLLEEGQSLQRKFGEMLDKHSTTLYCEDCREKDDEIRRLRKLLKAQNEPLDTID